MSYQVTRAVGRATNRTFVVTHVVGRATSDRSYRVTRVVGRATGMGGSTGTWKVTRAVGRAQAGSVPSGPLAEPFDLVALGDGVWVQTGGPAVTLTASGVFVAPALPNGADLTFQSGPISASIHINPHTVFGTKSTFPDPLYVSPRSEPRPTVT
jgi:hypothetical protein